MSTRTSITGVTIPDSSDDLGDFLVAVVQGFTDLQNFLFLPVDSKNASAAHDTYPVGISLLPLSTGTPATGWPDAAGVALVVTMRRGNSANGALQLWAAFLSEAEPQIKVRTGAATGWGPWGMVSGPGLPSGTDSGSVTFANNSASETRTVAFAAGVFKTPPNVVVTAQGGGYTACVPNGTITTAGFTVEIDPQQGGSAMSSTADRYVQWIAMENY